MNLHALCRCQKQPWTKRATRYIGKMRSGLPGRSGLCRRYRSPCRCIQERTTISGFVSRPRIPAIMRLRVRRSTMSNPPYPALANASTNWAALEGAPVIPGSIARATASTTGTTTAFPNCL